MAVYTVSQTIGVTRGQIVFRSGRVLHVFEQIDFVAHRIPAPDLSFTRPNLPFLSAEVEGEGE